MIEESTIRNSNFLSLISSESQPALSYKRRDRLKRSVDLDFGRWQTFEREAWIIICYSRIKRSLSNRWSSHLQEKFLSGTAASVRHAHRLRSSQWSIDSHVWSIGSENEFLSTCQTAQRQKELGHVRNAIEREAFHCFHRAPRLFSGRENWRMASDTSKRHSNNGCLSLSFCVTCVNGVKGKNEKTLISFDRAIFLLIRRTGLVKNNLSYCSCHLPRRNKTEMAVE